MEERAYALFGGVADDRFMLHHSQVVADVMRPCYNQTVYVYMIKW